MKTIKHIFDKFISDENIKLAFENYAKGRSNYRLVRLYRQNPAKAVRLVKEYISRPRNDEHYARWIFDTSSHKERLVVRPTSKEQVLHNMVVNIFREVYMPKFYAHSYCSIPGRGCLKGMKTLTKWIRKDKVNTRYYLQMDIRKYFESIDHEKLKGVLQRTFSDKRFLEYLYTCFEIKVNGRRVTKGLCIGFLSSQWLSNIYLIEFDKWVKDKLKVKYYLRYNDDLLFLGSNKRKLISYVDKVEKYLWEELRLDLKPNWKLKKIGNTHESSIDILGYRFYRNRTTLRKRMLFRLVRKAREINKYGATIHTARQFVSQCGWVQHADINNTYNKLVAPLVSKRVMRRKISRYDKRRNRELV